LSSLVLVVYATRYGSTQEVAEAVAATLRECGHAEASISGEPGTVVPHASICAGAVG